MLKEKTFGDTFYKKIANLFRNSFRLKKSLPGYQMPIGYKNHRLEWPAFVAGNAVTDRQIGRA